jgi:hypothetical protein
MLKNRHFEVEKNSEKKVKNQMRPTFFRDLHLISLFKYEKKICRKTPNLAKRSSSVGNLIF